MIIPTSPKKGLSGKVVTMGDTSSCCSDNSKRVRQPTLRASVKVNSVTDDCTNSVNYYLTKSIIGLADGDILPIDANGSPYGVTQMMELNANDVRIFISGLYKIDINFLFDAPALTEATINILVNGTIVGKVTGTGTDLISVNGVFHTLVNATDRITFTTEAVGNVAYDVQGQDNLYGGYFLVKLIT